MNYLNKAVEEVKDKIKDFIKKSSLDQADSDSGGIIRFEADVEDVNSLDWLKNQNCDVKLYWSDREHSLDVSGIGEADSVFAENNTRIDFDEILNRVKRYLPESDENIRYYGGIRFCNYKSQDMTWKNFGAYRFIVPRFEINKQENKSVFACNILIEEGKSSSDYLSEILLEFDSLKPVAPPYITNNISAVKRTDLPNLTEWKDTINVALEMISNRIFGKIVMARKSIIEYSKYVDPVELLRQLKKVNPDSFHFYFQPKPDNVFIGGSPERLYRREMKNILSEAIAGTRLRGETQDTDKILEEDLLTCDKDIREHQFVHQSIKDGLEKLCSKIVASNKITVIKLARIQHLYSRFQGTLSNGISDAKILKVLHPTPAVGGFPAEKAVEKLYELESFDRGWYAGPVGWIGNESSEFAVAIRSGLVTGNKLMLFSGAGIVTGSKPNEEWDEIEDKIKSFVKIINGK